MTCIANPINKLPQINSFCCGCELSTGAKFVAWEQIVANFIVELIGLAGILLLGNDIKPYYDHRIKAHRVVCMVGIAITMLISFFGIIMGVVLLIGINENNKKALKFWLYVKIVLLNVGIVLAMLAVLSMLYTNWVIACEGLLGIAIYYGIAYYFITVVKSYYVQQQSAFQLLTNDDP